MTAKMNYSTPETLEQFADALKEMTKGSRILSGGTDLTIQLRNQDRDIDYLIYPGKIRELHQITEEAGGLRIGAMATMNEISAAAGAMHPYAAVADAASDIGSPQIRSKATMAGNICNASPAGDMLPIGLLYHANVEVLSSNGEISYIPFKDFVQGPKQTVLETGQAVTAVILQTDCTGADKAGDAGGADRLRAVSAFKKIGSRARVSIARESLGILAYFDNENRIDHAVLCLGAVAPTPISIPEVSELLKGKQLSKELIKEVTPLIAETIHNNCRPANRLYKTEAAKGLAEDVFQLLWDRI